MNLEKFRDRVLAIQAVEEGLPPEVYTTLKAEMNVPDKTLSKVLRFSGSIILRRKREGRFKPDESERIMRLEWLFDLAKNVLEHSDNAGQWLQQRNLALGLNTPLEYAEAELGAREVEELLYRIEYNVLS